MAPLAVQPDRHRQFGAGSSSFCLLTDAVRVPSVVLAPSERYRRCQVLGLEPGETLESVLRDERCPQDADVVAVCPDSFLASPPDDAVGARRLSVLPCGSTPVTEDHLAYFIAATERSDPVALAARAEELTDALDTAGTVTLRDAAAGAEAAFDAWGDYEWNVQAGVLEPGEQQIAPAGELSALPVDIDEFDPGRRLRIDGTLAVRGAPIVHLGTRAVPPGAQAALFADLDVLRAATLLVDVAGGVVTGCRPADPAAKPAAEALLALLAEDERYRLVWEFGIGLNGQVEPQPGNCGLNEVAGGADGTVHLGFGLTPATAYALTFSCAGTEVLGDQGRRLCGGRPVRRLQRRRSATCGCH
jgi:hypothetical protein